MSMNSLEILSLVKNVVEYQPRHDMLLLNKATGSVPYQAQSGYYKLAILPEKERFAIKFPKKIKEEIEDVLEQKEKESKPCNKIKK